MNTTPDLVLAGKVRTGETRVSKTSGKSYPAATDYFLCDDPAFHNAVGAKPSSIIITPAYATVEDFWSSGLEWWTKTKAGENKLACYAKGDLIDGKPVAHRVENLLDPDDVKLGEKHGQQRFPIVCRVRECPRMGPKGCKPMGRLTFYLASGEGPYRLDSKSWYSVENIEKCINGVDQFGKASQFELSVAFQTKGDNRFPVLSMKEFFVEVNTPAEATAADATITLMNSAAECQTETDWKLALAAYLTATRPGWKQEQAYIDRIKEVGAEAAVKKIIAAAKS